MGTDRAALIGARRTTRRRPVALLLLLTAAACEPHVEGNGVLDEDDRTGVLGALDVRGVATWDGVAAVVTVGTTRSVVVSGDANVVSKVRTSVVTDTQTGLAYLNVSVGVPYSSVHPVRVAATLPRVELLRARGVEATPEESPSSVDARGLAATLLRVVAEDGAQVKVAGEGAGEAPALQVRLSGGADLDARNYEVATAEVHLSGASVAQVRASDAVGGVAAPPSRVENVLASGAACEVEDGDGNAVSCLP